MKSPYSDKVMDHFRNPRNVGELEMPDGKAKEGSPACGDMVVLTINVDEETKVIKDIRFKSYGCASNIATGSIITEMVKGKTIDEAKKIGWKDAADELGGLPAIKTHCSVLAVEALRQAITNYEEKHGLTSSREFTTLKLVNKRLRHVMNPMKGLDVIKTDLIENVEVEGGDEAEEKIIRIHVDLPEEHQFSTALKGDILEKLEHRWDVKDIVITFASD